MGGNRLRRVVFLDRDGILLDLGHEGSGKGTGGMVVPGAKAVLDSLKAAGFDLICVTNQPDIAKGTLRRDVTDRVHHALRRVLPLSNIIMCPHDKDADCKCRKPKPGMLLSVKDVDYARSYMVGDRWSDVAAGEAAGCTTILVGTGYGELFPTTPQWRAADLATAAQIILESA